MLFKRVLSSVLILSLVLIVLFLCPTWAFMLLAFAFCSIAIKELLEILNITTKIYPLFYDIACFCVILGAFYSSKGMLHPELYTLIIILSLFSLLFINIFRYKKGEILSSVVAPFLAIIYVTFLFSYVLKIRMLDNGPLLFLYLISVVKSGDIGAFMFGRKIGKHKLIPSVSPKKTVEGALAGFFCSMILAFALIPVSGFSFVQTAFIGTILAFLGQAGDLIESLIKRVCSVKDAGNNIPGFGGFLDLMDSIIFTAPVFYYFIIFVKGI